MFTVKSVVSEEMLVVIYKAGMLSCRQHAALTNFMATPQHTPDASFLCSMGLSPSHVWKPLEMHLRSLGLACDIDHTLINQSLTVLPRGRGVYPGVFPPWGNHAQPPADPMAISNELIKYLKEHAAQLHITNITEDKQWPDSALSLGGQNFADRPRAHELMDKCIQDVIAQLQAKKAIMVVSLVRTTMAVAERVDINLSLWEAATIW
jgi:hypothetical protein